MDVPQVINIIGDDPAGTLHGLPRIAGHSDLRLVLDEDAKCVGSVCREYATGLIGLAGFGILMIFLTSVATLSYCCARTCCKKRCCRIKAGGYTKFQRFFPLVVMFVFAAIVGAFCVIGYVANQDFSRGFSEDSSSVTKSLATFFDDVDALLLSVTVFMNTLRTTIGDQIDEVESLVFAVSPKLQAGTDNIVDQMVFIEQEYDNRTVISGGFEFPCGFCSDLSTRMGSMRLQVQSQTDAEFDSFEGTLDGLETTFVDAEADISSAIGSAEESIGDVQTTVVDQSVAIAEQLSNIEQYDRDRKLAFNVLFAIPLLSLLAVFVGGIIRKGFVFDWNYCLGECTIIFMWLLFAIHAPISALVADVCIALDEIEADDWDVGAFSGNESAVFAGCLDGVSLAESFGVMEQLNFSEAIEFPEVELDAEALFNFSELSSFADDTSTLNSSTFGGRVDDQLAEIERVNGTLFTRENLNDSYNPTAPAEIILKNVTLQMIIAEADAMVEFELIVLAIQNDTTELMRITTETKRTFNETINEMNQLEALMQPIFDQVDQVDDVTSCGFIVNLYDDLKGSICFTMLGGLGTIVLAVFLIGILMIPLLILSIVLSRRISRLTGKDHRRMDSEEFMIEAKRPLPGSGPTQQQARVIR